MSVPLDMLEELVKTLRRIPKLTVSVDENTEILQEIRDLLGVPPERPAVFVELPELEEKGIARTNRLLEEILSVSKGQILYSTFPAAGGLQRVGEGSVELNFQDGTVKFLDPDDGTEKEGSVSARLEGTPFQFMRSVYVETDQDVTFKLDDKGEFTVFANDFALSQFQQFERVTITAATTTRLRVWVCTNPTAVITRAAPRASVRGGAIVRTNKSQLLDDALALLTVLSTDFQLNLVLLHFSAAYSGTVTTTLDSALGSDFDTVLDSTVLSAATDLVLIFGPEFQFINGDQISVDVPVQTGITVGAQILTGAI